MTVVEVIKIQLVHRPDGYVAGRNEHNCNARAILQIINWKESALGANWRKKGMRAQCTFPPLFFQRQSTAFPKCITNFLPLWSHRDPLFLQTSGSHLGELKGPQRRWHQRDYVEACNSCNQDGMYRQNR